MISLIIVANNKWGDFATPYIESVLRYEPNTEIILVDNGSPEPYPSSCDYHLIRIDPTEHYNYMAALNAGARAAHGDWLMFSNDDVLCKGAFAKTIESQSFSWLYGMEVREKPAKWGAGKDFCYVYGWLLIMHRAVWEIVGEFDEYYLHAGFDDLDYSWRCQEKGVPLKILDLPFVHLADQPGNFHRRMTVEGYKENMKRSKAHFLEKVL
ncbi:MAG TPA: glycosyltransferase [Anaerolineaceae bacterium]|nr:glycosyltransferase [Anaerolineaceae bacterium]